MYKPWREGGVERLLGLSGHQASWIATSSGLVKKNPKEIGREW